MIVLLLMIIVGLMVLKLVARLFPYVLLTLRYRKRKINS